MDADAFLQEYADTRLREWWDSAPELRGEMLVLITELNQTPLAQLDQYTVGLHTQQPDGWDGPRLVFGIKNGRTRTAKATKDSFCLSLALNPQKITASVSHELYPSSCSGGERWSPPAEKLLEWINALEERQLQLAVDKRMELRRFRGKLIQRPAHRPRDYAQES